ncbi:putative ribosome-binding factor A, chloroplastic [Capsicum chinense]|nr:putative ribosome-binding factor A, chloroplastic [Capsicum annuum]PHU10648.1 putative ribosome-binding factor A, chloroplastic [Capsicum chinense]
MQHLVIQIPRLRPLLPSTQCLFPASSSQSVLTAKQLNFRQFNSAEKISSSRSTKHNRLIRCMANPRRVKMVAKQIKRELSDMLLTNKVLQYAVLPEAALGADRYLSSVTTISDVEVSTDLQNVIADIKFWLSSTTVPDILIEMDVLSTH